MTLRRPLELWIAAVVILLDQATKILVLRRLEFGESISVIRGFFDLTLVHNTGAAFGVLNAVDFPFKTAVLSVVAIAALAGIAWYTMTLPAGPWLARLGLALIVGGAAGNLLDRLRLGYVVDFVDLYWADWHFWAFNVADSAITVGAGLMLLDLLAVGRHRVSRTV